MVNYTVKSSQAGSMIVTRMDGRKDSYSATSTATGSGITYEKALEHATRAGAASLIRTLYQEATKPLAGTKTVSPVFSTETVMGLKSPTA